VSTVTVQQLLRKETERLRQAGVESPRLDAEVLLTHVLGWSREKLYVHMQEPVRFEDRTCYTELVDRRANGVPVAYLTGHKEFMSLEFTVTSDVLIPRPETELLVERVIEHMSAAGPQGLVVDVGTGSGAIAVSLAKYLNRVRVVALDISTQALAVAAGNARRHGVAGRITFVESNLLEAFPPEARGQADWIAANLPYIASGEMASLPREVAGYEPHLALDGGCDGLDLYRRLIPQAWTCLKPGGWLGMEIGPGQAQPLIAALPRDNWIETAVIKDYAGLDRFVVARRWPG